MRYFLSIATKPRTLEFWGLEACFLQPQKLSKRLIKEVFNGKSQGVQSQGGQGHIQHLWQRSLKMVPGYICYLGAGKAVFRNPTLFSLGTRNYGE